MSAGLSWKIGTCVEAREAVQARRQEPPQAQDVADDVAEVAEEDVAGGDQEGAGQGEHELDARRSPG